MTEYNPADHNVGDVKNYVEENPGDAQAVLDAEKARGDDARPTLVKHLEVVVEGQHDAPEAVEPKAVTVEPAAAPTAPGLLDGFEVTPDRGYRRKV